MAMSAIETERTPKEAGASAIVAEEAMRDATPVEKVPLSAPTAHPRAKPTTNHGSVYPPKDKPLPAPFVDLVRRLEAKLNCPVWCLIQNVSVYDHCTIEEETFKGFQASAGRIEDQKPVALLIQSPGGDAHFAYQIARLFQRRASRFTTVVPQCAKSAATLLALAGDQILTGRDAELGPLDVQMLDREREDFGSALDAVQALERLNAFSLTAIDQTMQLLLRRTRKRTDILLPHILAYASGFVRPLLEKIDTVDFTKKSRELKVAEEYALRLMKPNYDDSKARRIATSLVEKYPTHGFVIDPTEAENLGLNVESGDDELRAILAQLVPFLDQLTVIGRLEEGT
jgi:hypothetical protein